MGRIYELLVIDPANGCMALDEVLVSENYPEGIAFEAANPLCQGETGQIEYGFRPMGRIRMRLPKLSAQRPRPRLGRKPPRPLTRSGSGGSKILSVLSAFAVNKFFNRKGAKNANILIRPIPNTFRNFAACFPTRHSSYGLS